MKKSPRVAVIGAGRWGQNLVRVFGELGTLAGVYDSDPVRRKAVGGKYRCRTYDSLGSVLADPAVQAVIVATPATSHFTTAREALNAGKDVFVEKPLALSAESGKFLVNLAEKNGRILMVGHLLWYHPAILKLKELIDRGDLGKIRYIYSNRLNLGTIRREENILWSFAPHDVSVILGLLQEQPDQVQSQGGNYLHEKLADVTLSLLSFPSGVKAHIFVSWLHPFKEQKLIVVGEKKMAVFNDLEPRNKLLLYPHSIHWHNQSPVALKAQAQAVGISAEEPLRVECLHFLECVKKRSRPRTDGWEGARVLDVLERCQQALDHVPAARSKQYFAHESAFIDEGVEIGEGTQIWHVSHILKGSTIGRECRIGQNVVVGPDVAVGDNVKIQNNVSVYKGVTLEDHVFCGPSVVFTNVINPRSEIVRMGEVRPTLVKRGATLGANSTILCGVTIGRYAFVGAAAVATRDVPDYALVTGSPARIRGWVCECGLKLVWIKGEASCACGQGPYALKNERVRRGDPSKRSVA